MAPIADIKQTNTRPQPQTEGALPSKGAVVSEDRLSNAKAKAKVSMDVAVQKLKRYQGRALVLVKEPQFRTVTISTASGAVVLGSVGGAFGTASGIVLGIAAGAVPALFTFGLSLPIGAVVGGGTGLVVGTAAGTGVGAIGGGIAGFGGYKYRVQISNGIVTIKKKALMTQERVKGLAGDAMQRTKANVTVFVDGVRQNTNTAGQVVKARATQLAKTTQQVVASDKFKVTAATGAAGAVAGGGAGAMVGTATGVALGLVPALFTFGLSIPVGAVVGCCVGTASGTATGAAGGSAIGYGGYTYRKEIRSGCKALTIKVKDQTALAKSKLGVSAEKVSKSIRFYSGTGGTA